MCNGIKKVKCTLMKCHTNDNSTASTLLPHKFSYIVAILGHNHFESLNITLCLVIINETRNTIKVGLFVFIRLINSVDELVIVLNRKNTPGAPKFAKQLNGAMAIHVRK
jgi:hypothetical protein